MVEGNIVGGVDSIGGERVEEEAMAGAKVVGGGSRYRVGPLVHHLGSGTRHARVCGRECY